MSEPDLKWNKCDLSTAQQLLNNTAFPGQVFPLPLNDLPAGVQKMPGLSKAFISGFLEPKVAALDMTGVAEFVAVRYDGTTGKGYNFGLGVASDGSVQFIGPFRHFSGHHFQSGEAIPLESLFNRSNLSTS